MPKITLPISNGFYVSDALPISAQRCVNFRPNVPQVQSVTADNLFNTEGIRLVDDVSTGGNFTRGAHTMGGIPYFVIGNSLYSIVRTFDTSSNEVFTATLLGAIVGADRVYMADNGNQLCIVATPDPVTVGVSYIYSVAGGLVTITDAAFDGPADSVVYADGFFIFHKADGKKFFNSALQNGLSYDALDFSQAEADPDSIRALAVNKGQVLVIGSETIQIFRNIGRSPAPYQQIPGAVIDVGIDSPNSIAKFAGGIVFVGSKVNESPAIWMVGGTQVQKLSTTAIDNELSKLTDAELTSVFSWVFGESGSFFLGISTPSTTFVYDLTNSRWHERQSIDQAMPSQYRVSNIVTAYGYLMVGDVQDGRIGILDENVYTEYGTVVRRFVTSQPFDNSGNPMFVSMLEAVIESGVGLENQAMVSVGVNIAGDDILVTGGFDPQITLSWSDDGGRIFEGDLSRSMGKLGEYNHRAIWRRLGRFPRSRTLKFEVTSPTKATLIKVEANING